MKRASLTTWKVRLQRFVVVLLGTALTVSFLIETPSAKVFLKYSLKMKATYVLGEKVPCEVSVTNQSEKTQTVGNIRSTPVRLELVQIVPGKPPKVLKKRLPGTSSLLFCKTEEMVQPDGTRITSHTFQELPLGPLQLQPNERNSFEIPDLFGLFGLEPVPGNYRVKAVWQNSEKDLVVFSVVPNQGPASQVK